MRQTAVGHGASVFRIARCRVHGGNTGVTIRKLADMILVDGDPMKNIRDLDKLTTVIKGGAIYDPAAIEKALGIAPRRGPRD